MAALDAASKVLQARNRQRAAQTTERPFGLVVADILADISFFVGFIVYPSTSTAIFMFFMSETYDGPGEDGVTVMLYDRSIETGSEFYIAFVPYALVMLMIYPIGIPFQVESIHHDSNREG
jgi:hypothetical protein